MKPFKYHAPTALYFDRGCIEKNSEIIRSFGRRAFIISARFPEGTRNYALEDVTALYTGSGLNHCVYDDVEENPSVESVVRIAEAIRRYAPELIIAVGGGSALDSAKAANVLIAYDDGCDAYKVFYGGTPCINSRSSGVLPLLAVPTTAGSGSEVMGYAVLTRRDTDTKLRMNQLSFFDAAFLDAKYICESPQWLLDNGALDALAHGVEGYLNTFCCAPERHWHDYGFRLFALCKEQLLNGSIDFDACERLLGASAFQGMAVMQSGTSIPHGMGYPLTHFKHMPHGLASAVTLPAYLSMFRSQENVEHILSMCRFDSIADFRSFIDTVVWRNFDCTVTMEEIEKWSRECYGLGVRLARHPEHIELDGIIEMYKTSFEGRITE